MLEPIGVPPINLLVYDTSGELYSPHKLCLSRGAVVGLGANLYGSYCCGVVCGFGCCWLQVVSLWGCR